MYTLEDLFDRRSPVGTRLEQILMEKKCTKAELIKEDRGFQTRTIDKVLSGTITSKKIMKHICQKLELSPNNTRYFIGK